MAEPPEPKQRKLDEGYSRYSYLRHGVAVMYVSYVLIAMRIAGMSPIDLQQNQRVLEIY